MSRENKNIEKNLAELVGIDKNKYRIAVINNCSEFIQGIDNPQEPEPYDTSLVAAEILSVCDDVLSQHQDVGGLSFRMHKYGALQQCIKKSYSSPDF